MAGIVLQQPFFADTDDKSRFCAIAAAYGIQSENVCQRGNLDGAIERMMAYDGPYLLNVSIREEDMVFPMTPVGSAVNEIMLNAKEMYHPKKQKS